MLELLLLQSIALRLISVVGRFGLVAGAYYVLHPEEFKAFSFIIASQQVALYLMGLDIYQITHRQYRATLDGVYIQHHFTFLLIMSSAVTFCMLMSIAFDIDRILIAILASSLGMCLFLESYRYSGLLERPVSGEVVLACKSVLSLMTLWAIKLELINSAIELIIILSLVDASCFVILIYSLFREFSLPTRKLRTALIYFSTEISVFLKILLSTVSLRIYQNIDKLLSYIYFASVTADYYFTSMLAFAGYNIIESVYNNHRITKILDANSSKNKKLIVEFCSILVATTLCLYVILFLGSKLLPEFFVKLSVNTMIILSLAASINSLSNLFHQFIYARRHDGMLAIISFLPILLILPLLNVFDLSKDISMAWAVLLLSVIICVIKLLYYRRLQGN